MYLHIILHWIYIIFSFQEEDVVGTSGCLDESDNEFVVDSDSEEFDSAGM